MKLSDLKNLDDKALAAALNVEGREVLLERLAVLGLPDKKSEAYRYFDVAALLEKEYRTLNYMPKTIEVGEKIEIVDGIVTTAPKGLRIYYEPCEMTDPEHFDPMYYLGHLLSGHTIKIEIDGDVELDLEHRFTQSDALINYRIVLYNQSNRHATLYENFIAEILRIHWYCTAMICILPVIRPSM